MVVEEKEYRMRPKAKNENPSQAESLPKRTWMLLLNKGMLSHELKGEKAKTLSRPPLILPANTANIFVTMHM